MEEKVPKETIDGYIDSITNQPALITGNLRVFILGLMLFTFVCCILLFFLPRVSNVLVINPARTAIKYFAMCLAIFAVAGIMCIFIESMRIPVLVALGIYFMVFLIYCAVYNGYEGIDYSRHKNAASFDRSCVITKHKVEGANAHLDMFNKGEEYPNTTFYMDIKFHDDGKEYSFSETNEMLLFFNCVELGDTATAQVINGTLGIQYICSLYK
jgi:hypothetical protein